MHNASCASVMHASILFKQALFLFRVHYLMFEQPQPLHHESYDNQCMGTLGLVQNGT